jgi:hypothetical protein
MQLSVGWFTEKITFWAVARELKISDIRKIFAAHD